MPPPFQLCRFLTKQAGDAAVVAGTEIFRDAVLAGLSSTAGHGAVRELCAKVGAGGPAGGPAGPARRVKGPFFRGASLATHGVLKRPHPSPPPVVQLVCEFLVWSIKSLPPSVSDASSLATHGLLRGLYALLDHPSPGRRLGGALALAQLQVGRGLPYA